MIRLSEEGRIARSIQWRIMNRPRVRYMIPIISPYSDKLRAAAMGDHVCRLFRVPFEAGG